MGNIFGKSDDSEEASTGTGGPHPPYPPVSKSKDGASEVISCLSFNENYGSRNPRRPSDGAKLGTRFSQKVILPQETIRVLPSRTDGFKHSIGYNQKIDEHSHETIRALPSRTVGAKLGTPFSQKVILSEETIRVSRTDGTNHSIRYNQKIDEEAVKKLLANPTLK